MKEQREANREEQAKVAQAKHAAAMREEKFKHEKEQSTVAKAVAQYHAWRTGAQVKCVWRVPFGGGVALTQLCVRVGRVGRARHEAKEFKKESFDPNQRSWRQQHEARVRAKRKALRVQAQAKKAVLDRVAASKAKGYLSRRQRLAGTQKGPTVLATETRSSSKWAKYSKKNTSWKPPPEAVVRKGVLLSPLRRPDSFHVTTAGVLRPPS